MTRSERLDEMQRAVDRDVERVSRPRTKGGILHAMALIGSVGWPIALLAGGGAIAGHLLDRRLGTGVAMTLVLLVLGVTVGSFVAARALRGDRRRR